MTLESISENLLNRTKKFHEAMKVNSFNLKTMEDALLSVKDKGLPDPKNEDWKYTKYSDLLSKELLHSLDFQYNKHKPILNNCFKINFSGVTPALEESFQSICSECLVQFEEFDGNEKFQLVTEKSFDTFTNLNISNTEGVLTINVKDNVQISKPILITFNTLTKDEDALFNPRVHINLGKDSSCSVIEYYPEGQLKTNALTTAECHKNSQLNHYKILQNQTVHFGSFKSKGHEHSNTNCFIYSEGCKAARTSYTIELLEEESHAEVNGLYYLNESNHSDHQIDIIHQAGNTTSNQLFKGVLSDEAKGAFTGKVYIARGANGVDANQLNKNLLLSKKARVNTRPSLEVYADDVACAHGATTGQLNEDELFYLISRGIEEDKAHALLLNGFVFDAMEKVSHKELKDWFIERFNSLKRD